MSSEATYASSGVDTSEVFDGTLARLLACTNATFEYAGEYGPLMPNGYFANIVRAAPGIGIALSTDGVGTKLLVAELANRYESVGIDLVAMNANDVLCVGARPIAMLDYIAIRSLDAEVLAALGIGLQEGCRQAGCSIPAGEIAQVPEMIRGADDADSDSGLDLVGTCIGVVGEDRILDGSTVSPGDVIIGLTASGIHSNGVTLARRALLGSGSGATPDEQRKVLAAHEPAVGRPLVDELLEPTRIYVKPVLALIDAGLDISALAHITGDGLLNLTRVAAANVGFRIDNLPPAPAIFGLLAERGGVSAAEMFTVFNMGVGFCVVVKPADAERALALLEAAGESGAMIIGEVVRDERRRVTIVPEGLVGEGKAFAPA